MKLILQFSQSKIKPKTVQWSDNGVTAAQVTEAVRSLLKKSGFAAKTIDQALPRK